MEKDKQPLICYNLKTRASRADLLRLFQEIKSTSLNKEKKPKQSTHKKTLNFLKKPAYR